MYAADLLTNRTRLTPDREALLELETGQRFTYAELNARVNRAASWLLNNGIVEGDRISILANNDIAFIDLFYACGKMGAVFTPLNWRLAPVELNYIVNDCTPRVLLVGAEFEQTAVEMRSDINVEQIVSLAQYEEAVARQPPDEPPIPAGLNSESPYCILYTSGTTGQPKGAVIPHRQVLWNCVNTAASWGLTEQDVSPVFTPLFHAGGLFAFLTPLFYLGGRIILDKGFDPELSLHIILEEKCTVILGVPTLFQMWQSSPQYETADFSHVHFFISGGAPCPPKLINAWRQDKKIVFRQGYGLTEVGPNCFSMTDEESVPKTGSVGKPIFHSEMRLTDSEGDDVAVGETGELLIKGPHVSAGYWHNPDASAKALVDGWFHTGDMARMDEDGFYTIVGRFKDMIISGGENVYAAEVETVFMRHTAVAECALIGKPDDKWGEVGHMITVIKKDAIVTEAELQQFCRQKLTRYKIPKQITFTDELPHSPYGKVEKNKLKKMYAS